MGFATRGTAASGAVRRDRQAELHDQELDNDTKRDDLAEIAAVKWFFEVFQQEADNIRAALTVLNEVLARFTASLPPSA